MAERTAKVSAIRGEETKFAVAACCETEIRSSTTQPNPASPVVEFHAASVKIVHRSGSLGLGSDLIKDLGGFGVLDGWASAHSLASDKTRWIVSSGERLLFSKMSWFLDFQRVQQIQADSVPASRPIGGREGNFLAFSHPS